jgi:hypothetical protein
MTPKPAYVPHCCQSPTPEGEDKWSWTARNWTGLVEPLPPAHWWPDRATWDPPQAQTPFLIRPRSQWSKCVPHDCPWGSTTLSKSQAHRSLWTITEKQ